MNNDPSPERQMTTDQAKLGKVPNVPEHVVFPTRLGKVFQRDSRERQKKGVEPQMRWTLFFRPGEETLTRI